MNSLRINVRASALTLPLYMQDQFELYEAEFGGQVTEKDFKLATKKINNALLDHWPCLNCRFFAYGNGPSPDCHRHATRRPGPRALSPVWPDGRMLPLHPRRINVLRGVDVGRGAGQRGGRDQAAEQEARVCGQKCHVGPPSLLVSGAVRAASSRARDPPDRLTGWTLAAGYHAGRSPGSRYRVP